LASDSICMFHEVTDLDTGRTWHSDHIPVNSGEQIHATLDYDKKMQYYDLSLQTSKTWKPGTMRTNQPQSAARLPAQSVYTLMLHRPYLCSQLPLAGQQGFVFGPTSLGIDGKGAGNAWEWTAWSAQFCNTTATAQGHKVEMMWTTRNLDNSILV